MEVYKGPATGRCDNESLVGFLNYVFGMNETGMNFYRLLPKLYKPEYHPEEYNYVVIEDGSLCAAAGAYPFGLNIAGETLKGAGIGNVAVHPMHRGKGYMIDCMKMALDEVVKNGADFAVLGGRRQRYSYFGFEPGGVVGEFSLSRHNMQHAFGEADSDTGYTVRELSAEDLDELDNIKALLDRRDYCPVRDNASYFDILSSWCSKIYTVADAAGKFAGYFIYGGDDGETAVMELDCTEPDRAEHVLRKCFETVGKDTVTVYMPEFNVTFYDLLSDIAEGVTLANTEHYSVYNYKKVINSTLKLKAGCARLCDGELSVEIDGFAGKEKLLISVRNGEPSVCEFDGKCDLKFNHRQAMGVFFGLLVPEKRMLPGFATGWFPLPLVTAGAENC